MGILDFLLGDTSEHTDNTENFRSISENRRHRASGSGNWTSREDWNCDSADQDGMSGFDSYEENDF